MTLREYLTGYTKSEIIAINFTSKVEKYTHNTKEPIMLVTFRENGKQKVEIYYLVSRSLDEDQSK